MRFLTILLVLCLVACNANSDAEPVVEPSVDTSAIHESAPVITTDNTPVNQQVDSIIRFKFNRDSSTLTASGTLKSAKDRIIGYLSVDQESQLTAVLDPSDSKMNIRFTQIVMPDGRTDGPFGQKISYTLKQPGTYQIIIAPSNMAGGKTSGEYKIRLGVSPNPHEY